MNVPPTINLPTMLFSLRQSRLLIRPMGRLGPFQIQSFKLVQDIHAPKKNGQFLPA